MGINRTQPLGDRAEEVHMQAARRQLEDVLERPFVHTREQRWRGGGRFGGTRLTIQESHLSEEIARFDETECLLTTAPAGLGDLDRSFANQVERISRIAFVE